MPTARKAKKPAQVGYAAHNERSRATFLINGQHILAKYGLNATTRQIQSVTGVSPTTLYRYFKNRETYLQEALESIWSPWITQSLELGSKFEDPLLTLVLPLRMLLNVQNTAPKLAAIFSHPDFTVEKFIPHFSKDAISRYKSLIEAGLLPDDQTDARIRPFAGAYIYLLKSAASGLDAQQANASLAIALSMLSLSNSQIKKVMQAPLPNQ